MPRRTEAAKSQPKKQQSFHHEDAKDTKVFVGCAARTVRRFVREKFGEVKIEAELETLNEQE